MFDFDLSSVDTLAAATVGVEMPLKDLRGRPMKNSAGSEIKLILMGIDSPEYQAVQIANIRRSSERAVNKAGDDEIIAGRIDDNLRATASCVRGWSGMLDSCGSEIPYSPDAALELVKRYPAVRDQIENFVADRVNFLRVSLKN